MLDSTLHSYWVLIKHHRRTKNAASKEALGLIMAFPPLPRIKQYLEKYLA